MKKEKLAEFIKEAGFPEKAKDIKITHSKEYHKANKELSAYLNELPITKDQCTKLLILVTESSIIAEIDAYIQGLGDGFVKGSDWERKYVDNICKENAEKYDILLREKIIEK